ncbi:MAG: ribonuclease E/G, partial [Rhodoglobus sp.]
MVENNDNTENTENTGKRARLFGRRASSAAPSADAATIEPADAVQASQAEVTTQVPAEKASRKRPAAKKASEHVSASTATEIVAAQDAGMPEPAADSAPKTRPRTRKAPEATVPETVETAAEQPVRRPTTSLLFQAPDLPPLPERSGPLELPDEPGTVRRRSRRRPGEEARPGDDAPNTVVRVREPRRQQQQPELITEPQRVKGSTRLEAKKQRRRDGRDAGRRRPVVTESEFLARREAVDRVMVVRSKFGRIQIAVLEDGVLVEHYVARSQEASLIGNVYLGRVQNVLPSMEAAFVDIGRGRNAVLYSGEVDWDAAALDSDGKTQPRRIELALKPGDRVLVQVTKDPVGHKGARLTSQVSLPGRYLVYVPNGSMSGISRKLPDTERARLKRILKEVLPENVGVIVRTAAEGATEEQLTLDVQRLTTQWAEISHQVETVQAPALLHSEPDLLIKIIRDVFNEDFHRLVI